MLLAEMVRDKLPMKYIRSALGRSESAIYHALRNTMYHHLLDYHPEDVARHYATTEDNLASGIVPPKYRIPLPPCNESHFDNDAQPPHELFVWVFFIALLCIGGAGVYVQMLCNGWNTLTVSS